MDEHEQTPAQFMDTDSIQNLDTARMALRWALERLQKLDKDKAELDQKLGLEQRAKTKALEEYASLQRALALRSGEADQRELYYAKLEEFLSMQLQGKLDPTALAKRELEAEQLRQLLDRKQGQLDKDYELKRVNLDSEYRRLREQGSTKLVEQQKRLEQSFQSRQGSLEQEHLSRMSELHQKDAQIKSDEKAFAERQRHFEEYYQAQHVQLNSEMKRLRAEIDDQVRFRVDMAQRLIAERQTALEASWTQEKALLIQELESWKRRSGELGPKVIELQNELALMEDAARRHQASSDVNAAQLRERQGTWAAEKEKLQQWLEQDKLSQAAERQEWRQKAQDAFAKILSLEQRLALAEDSLAQSRSEAEKQTAITQERLRAARIEGERLLIERQADKQWAAQQSQRANEQEMRSATLEEQLARAKAETAAEAERWQERCSFLEKERETLLAQISALHRHEEDVLPKRLELEAEMLRHKERSAQKADLLIDLEKKLAAERAAQSQTPPAQSEPQPPAPQP